MVVHHETQPPASISVPQTSPDSTPTSGSAMFIASTSGVVAVLEHHDRIALEVFHVLEVGHAACVAAQHPADVREPHAAARRIGVEVFVVDEAVVRAMSGRPDVDAVLNRHRAEQHEEEAHGPMRFVGAVCPQSVIAGRDREARSDQEDPEPYPRGSRVADQPAIQRYADRW